MSTRTTALITGGAGFIGTNLADALMREGRDVMIFDDLSRSGAQANLDWLFDRHPDRLSVEVGDIRDAEAVASAVRQAVEVYHLAAQVAVTSSLRDPRTDFAINAQGTLNVLEAIRQRENPPALLFTSTNKVYGALEDVALTGERGRYVPTDGGLAAHGFSESLPLDFHSPYGCSKGAADQYVRDYARCFGLRTVVFRMSCIYGPHQQGNEDQGWVAHFLMRARASGTLNIFGSGEQVRDVLYVEDLVEAMRLAMRHSPTLAGRVFNIGGGPTNTLSLLELISELRERGATRLRVQHADVRQGDQRYYVSDTSAFSAATGWRPRTGISDGLERLTQWLEGAAAPFATRTASHVVAVRW